MTMGENFSLGDTVRISDRFEARHHRTPAYVKGRLGTVIACLEEEGRPERLAAGESAEPRQMVYRVRLNQVELWPAYDGHSSDTLEIEIFHHWLSKCSEAGS